MIARIPGEGKSMSCRLPSYENRHGISDYHSQQLQEELWDDAEMTPTLLLVRLHRKSRLFPDIYYNRYGTHFTLMHDMGKGYNVGDPQKFLGALLHNAFTSGKNPSPKAKLPPAYLDMPATSPLIESCTREYRDWTEECPTPEGAPDEHPALEEHALSGICIQGLYGTGLRDLMIRGRHSYPRISLWDYHPYGTGPIGLGSPLGSWIQRNAPNQSIRFWWTPPEPAPWMRGRRRKRRKRRNIVIPRNRDKPELKVTTLGQGS